MDTCSKACKNRLIPEIYSDLLMYIKMSLFMPKYQSQKSRESFMSVVYVLHSVSYSYLLDIYLNLFIDYIKKLNKNNKGMINWKPKHGLFQNWLMETQEFNFKCVKSFFNLWNFSFQIFNFKTFQTLTFRKFTLIKPQKLCDPVMTTWVSSVFKVSQGEILFQWNSKYGEILSCDL